MKETIDKLLERIKFEMKYDKEQSNAINEFNIFNVLGVETKEVIICRFLGEFLNPKGSHNLGDKPLQLFFKTVLGEENISLSCAESATVVLEDHIENDRRIDIVIKFADKIYPIEVKVWAGDQDAQLSDYYHYYKPEKIYYLTPTGWNPSYASRRSLTVGKEIKCISFEKHIKKWMQEVMSIATQKEQDIILQFIILQFIKVIDDMCEKNKKLESLKKVLELDNKFDINDSLKATIDLLSNADALLKQIRINYLFEHIVPNKKYSLDICEDEDVKKIDCHILLRVYPKDSTQPVAWICVQDNLYLVAQKVKTVKKWVKGKKDNYYWQYIKPEKFEKENAFPLKDLSFISNDDKIYIEELFDDIDF